MLVTAQNATAVFDSIKKPERPELTPRPMFFKLGSRSSAKGSAYLEYGKTKVIAQVEPPKEMSTIARKLNNNNQLCSVECSIKYTAFANPLNADLSQKELGMSLSLKKAIEPMICRHEYPSFQINIEVQVIDDDGCCLSAAIMCAGAAVADAGIATYDLITASTIAYYKGYIFTNPDNAVEQLLDLTQKSGKIEEYGYIVVSSLNSVQQLSECFQMGYLPTHKILPLVDYADEINKLILETVRHVLVQKIEEYVEINGNIPNEVETVKEAASKSIDDIDFCMLNTE